MTTIKLSGGGLGGETMMVRCNLARCDSPVEVDYRTGAGWEPTQYQGADARHESLVTIGKRLAARAVEVPESEFDCGYEYAGR